MRLKIVLAALAVGTRGLATSPAHAQKAVGGYARFLTQSSTPATPPAGFIHMFINTSTGHVETVNSSGTVTDIQAGGGGGTTQTIDVINATAATAKTLTAAVANSGTNVAFTFNNSTTLSGSTIIASFQNNGTVEATLDNAGTLTAQTFVVPNSSGIFSTGFVEGIELHYSDLAAAIYGGSLGPVSNGGGALGTTVHEWGGLFNNGPLSCSYNAQTGTTYAATTSDCEVSVANASAKTVTLPAASTMPPGGQLLIVDGSHNAGSVNISVARTGSDTINGGTSTIAVVTANSAHSLCIADGTSVWVCGVNN